MTEMHGKTSTYIEKHVFFTKTTETSEKLAKIFRFARIFILEIFSAWNAFHAAFPSHALFVRTTQQTAPLSTAKDASRGDDSFGMLHIENERWLKKHSPVVGSALTRHFKLNLNLDLPLIFGAFGFSSLAQEN